MLVTTGLALMILNGNIETENNLLETVDFPQIHTGDLYGNRDFEEMKQQIIDFQIQEEARIKAEQEAEAKRLAEEAQRLKEEEEARQRALLKPTFNPYNLREKSNITEEQFYSLLNNTGLYDVAWVFSFCEERFNINSVALASITALESGWGNSRRAVYDNNLTGYNITSDSSTYKFNSRAESVIETARLLDKDYLTENGRYYNGISIYDVNKKYCASDSWAYKVETIAYGMINDLLSQK